MTDRLSDDDRVGALTHVSGVGEIEIGTVRFRDLDKHIQDRLRAAEEMARSIHEYEAACREYAAASKSPMGNPASKGRVKSSKRHRMQDALAAYEATSKERDIQVHEESYYTFPCFDPEHETLEERIAKLEAVVEAADAREEAIRLALRCKKRNAPFEPHCYIGAEHRRLLEDDTYRQARAALEEKND